MSAAIAAPDSNAIEMARAVRITKGFAIDELTVDTIPVSRPGPGQVLVKIKAVSLNYRDLLILGEKYNHNPTLPLIIGSDGAGEIVAVGEGVTQFKTGDRVAGAFFQDWADGRFKEEFRKSSLGGGINGVLTTARVFNQGGLVHLPGHLSFEEGATLPCAAVTAWQALVSTAHLKSGDTVLVLGTGGVSIFGLQFAKLHGARVIVTSSSNEKLARAKALGADEFINYRETPEWGKEVLRLTEGEGVDVVLETGGAGTLPRSMQSVRPQGQISLIGVLTGINDPVNIRPVILRSIRVQGIDVGSVKMFKEMNRAIVVNALKPVIDRTFPFDDAREALRYLKSAQHFGKVVITVE